MLADNVAGMSYLDETWGNALAGEYRFGISEVFANGVEYAYMPIAMVLNNFLAMAVALGFALKNKGNEIDFEKSLQVLREKYQKRSEEQDYAERRALESY